MTQIHGETVEEIKKETVRRMTRSVNDLGRAMASIRTGRASIALLDSIAVDYYGTLTPLSQMASLATPTSTDPDDPALGHLSDRHDRAGHPHVRPRHQPRE